MNNRLGHRFPGGTDAVHRGVGRFGQGTARQRNSRGRAASDQLILYRLIASALDAKSPCIGGHCVRVPAIAEMLTEAAHQVKTGPFANFSLSENDREELFCLMAA